ncbi:DUF5017 domain-containing protein [Pedobacter hiemivivus]|uniref:DUF5017 domain-containing protein n=1 Tax=Pedobacter hiemivivus TaxID=2530454 RepID=A0A4R0N8W1_9SPHI|nr:DUF5017 domain-containing protein [Pedobacter hiemivivus]TCC96465.1 DUF5017 domain-containing protein [Pedobacter hiemivivus]
MKCIYMLLFAVLLFVSCKKMDVVQPDFEVQLSKFQYKVDDTLRFNFSGDVENIVFYSGERGFRYANKDVVTIERGIPQLQFTTALAGTAQANSLKVLVTKNLLGKTSENILASNWTDISDQVTLAVNSTSTVSGIIDLSTYAADDTPFALAFKYDAVMKPTVAQPTWVVRAFSISNLFPDKSTLPLVSLATGPWMAYNFKNPTAAWVVSATELRMNGGAANSADNEDWLVTGPLNLNATKEVADFGLAIQNLAGRRLTNYSYVYKNPGVYKVTLVGFNNNIDGNKKVVREFEITVTQ